MNIHKFITGLKLIYRFLMTNPLELLRTYSHGEGEEADVIRYTFYIVNFAMANLGIVILLLSVYMWYGVTSPDNFRLNDNFGHTFTINDIKKMSPTCLMACNGTYSMNITKNSP